jgi:hypothetical protein
VVRWRVIPIVVVRSGLGARVNVAPDNSERRPCNMRSFMEACGSANDDSSG